MLGAFCLPICPKADATSGGGWELSALEALNSLTSDLSNGFVGSCILDMDGFEGSNRLLVGIVEDEYWEEYLDVSIEADESTAVVVVILLSCEEISSLFIDRDMEPNKLLLEEVVKDGAVGQSLLHTGLEKVGRIDGVVGGDFVELPRRCILSKF